METRVKDLGYCSVCLDRLENPRTLPCEHNLCKQCLADLIKSRIVTEGEVDPDGLTILCPECQAECDLSKLNSLDSYKASLFLRQFVDRYRGEGRSLEEGEGSVVDSPKRCVQCSACLAIPVLTCVQCDECCCEKCFKKDKDCSSWPICSTAGCSESGLLGPGNDGAQKHIVFRKESASIFNCLAHNISVDYYCSQCKELICLDCYLASHKGHTTKTKEFIKTEVLRKSADYKFNVDANISKWCEIQNSVDNAVKMIEEKSRREQDRLKVLQMQAMGFLCLSFDRVDGNLKEFYDAKKRELLNETIRDDKESKNFLQLFDTISSPGLHVLKIIAQIPKFVNNINELQKEKLKMEQAVTSLQSKNVELKLPAFKVDRMKMFRSISEAFNYLEFDTKSVKPRPVEIPTDELQCNWLMNYLLKAIKSLPDAIPAKYTDDAGIACSDIKVPLSDNHALPVFDDGKFFHSCFPCLVSCIEYGTSTALWSRVTKHCFLFRGRPEIHSHFNLLFYLPLCSQVEPPALDRLTLTIMQSLLLLTAPILIYVCIAFISWKFDFGHLLLQQPIFNGANRKPCCWEVCFNSNNNNLYLYR